MEITEKISGPGATPTREREDSSAEETHKAQVLDTRGREVQGIF